MKKAFSVFLLAVMVVVSLQAQQREEEENTPWVKKAYPGFIDFQYGDIDVNQGIVEQVSFDKSHNKCNLTLYNQDDISKDVDVRVNVYNEDGAVLWQKEESWFTNIDAGQRYTHTYDFHPAMPEELEKSRFSDGFDPTPVAIEFILNGSEK